MNHFLLMTYVVTNFYQSINLAPFTSQKFLKCYAFLDQMMPRFLFHLIYINWVKSYTHTHPVLILIKATFGPWITSQKDRSDNFILRTCYPVWKRFDFDRTYEIPVKILHHWGRNNLFLRPCLHNIYKSLKNSIVSQF